MSSAWATGGLQVQGPRSHGVQGVNWPPTFSGAGSTLDPSLFVVFTCAQSVAVVIHSFIHSLHSALASGAVYCSRSRLCVCGGRAGVRTLLQPTRAVFASLRTLFSFIHSFSYCCSTHQRQWSFQNIWSWSRIIVYGREGRGGSGGRKGGGVRFFPEPTCRP